MPESFGARLRQRREEQGVALVTIAEQTKIKLSLLEAVERDDLSHWPSGIYSRAYIRAYAQAIGLNPDIIAAEFLAAHPLPEEVVTTDAIASVMEARSHSGPPTRLRNIVDSAIGSFGWLKRNPAPATPDSVPDAAADVLASTGAASGRTVVEPVAGESEYPIRRNELAEQTLAPAPAPVPSQEPAGYVPMAAERVAPLHADRGTHRERRSSDHDWAAIAHLCTELGRVDNPDGVQLLLQEAARILDAAGLIVWVWDPEAGGLRPALAHGYSERVLAQLPTVPRDADNVTAAAFRSGQPCALNGRDQASGALVVPLLAPDGCAGVLAIELTRSRERRRSVNAVATIVAALLARLIGRPQPVASNADVAGSAIEELGLPVLAQS